MAAGHSAGAVVVALAADSDAPPSGGTMPVFAVTTAKGPNWDYARGIREQPFFDDHAVFTNGLVDQGFIIFGGPVASDDEQDIALLAVEAADEDALRAAFDDDPWTVQQVFRIKQVRAWTVWLDGRSVQARLSRVAAQRVVGGDLDEDEPHAVRVLDPHLGQPPRLFDRLAQDPGPGRGQAAVLGADVPYLQPDHDRAPGRPGSVPGHLEQSLAEEEHHAGIVGWPELAVHRQAQHVAVEPPAPVQVSGTQQDAAAQDLHTEILSPGRSGAGQLSAAVRAWPATNHRAAFAGRRPSQSGRVPCLKG
jgi:uncharacterized protein YciI